MTLLVDASALLAATIDGPDRELVCETLGAHPDDACASTLALTEAVAAIDRLTDQAVMRRDLEDGIRRLWDHLHVVPVDQRCLDAAAMLARQHPIRLSDAIQFAAAQRLPGPVRFVTVDPTHLTTALDLGLDVISTSR